MVIVLVVICNVQIALAESPPHPPSPVVKSVVFYFFSRQQKALGSDNWPITWADDDHQYTTWGDGGGFVDTNNDGRVSLGFARIEGSWNSYKGYNVWGGKSAENQALFGGKSYGIISIDGILYAWWGPGSGTQCYTQTRLLESVNHGATWKQSSWNFINTDSTLIMPTICNFGRDYTGTRDNYVYHYFIRKRTYLFGRSLNVHKPGKIDLARVPKDLMMDQASYEFYAGLDDGGKPIWTSNEKKRKAVFEDPNGVGWNVSVSYNPALKRYFLMTEHAESFKGNLGIFDAPEPWGPWATVGYYSGWGGFGSTFYWNFSNKWLSADGKDFIMVFTGTGANDSWNMVRGHFIPY
jgi:hypothetical protein